MEILIALFIAGWLILASVLSTIQLKKEFKEYLDKGEKE